MLQEKSVASWIFSKLIYTQLRTLFLIYRTIQISNQKAWLNNNNESPLAFAVRITRKKGTISFFQLDAISFLPALEHIEQKCVISISSYLSHQNTTIRKSTMLVQHCETRRKICYMKKDMGHLLFTTTLFDHILLYGKQSKSHNQDVYSGQRSQIILSAQSKIVLVFQFIIL